jgi:hypothetical protein
VAERNLLHVAVDQGDGGRRRAQREPFNDLGEFRGPAVGLALVPARVPGESDEALTPILGEPSLRGPQRNAMLTRHMGQRHVVFQAGLEHPIAFQGSGAFLRGERRQWQGGLGLPVHRPLLEDRWLRDQVCRQDRLVGKEMQAPGCSNKRFAHAPAVIPRFLFGKVSTARAPSRRVKKLMRPRTCSISGAPRVVHGTGSGLHTLRLG